jgi:preprotein translocase SecE subunit
MPKKGSLNKIAVFFSEVRQETRKVSWPSRKEAIKYTLIVAGVSIAVAAFLGGLDFILQRFLII